MKRLGTHIDGHTLALGQPNMSHLGDVLRRLHISRIAARTKDHGDLGVWIDVVGRNEGTGSVVDNGQEFCANFL